MNVANGRLLINFQLASSYTKSRETNTKPITVEENSREVNGVSNEHGGVKLA